MLLRTLGTIFVVIIVLGSTISVGYLLYKHESRLDIHWTHIARHYTFEQANDSIQINLFNAIVKNYSDLKVHERRIKGLEKIEGITWIGTSEDTAKELTVVDAESIRFVMYRDTAHYTPEDPIHVYYWMVPDLWLNMLITMVRVRLER
jgi:hypothetical protein